MRLPINFLIVFLAATLGLHKFVYAQVQPQITSYLADDYGADAQNWACTQDENGYIYIANSTINKGVLQFDGQNWTPINTGNSLTVSLDLGTKGRIYTGGQNNFGYIEPDSLGALKYTSLSVLLADSLQTFGVIWQTHFLNGKVYFNNGGTHIFIWDEGSKNFTVLTPKNDFHKTFEINNQIWVRDTYTALHQITDGTLNTLPNTDSLANASLLGVVPYSKNEVLLLTNYNRFSDKNFTIYNPTTGDHRFVSNKVSELINPDQPYNFQKISGNRYLVGTLRNGFYVLNQSIELIEHISKEEGLADNMVLYLFEDNQKNIWACLNDGISKVQISDPIRVAKKGLTYQGGIEDITRFNNQLFISTQSGVFAQIPDTGKSSSSNNNYTFQQVGGIKSVQCWELKEAYGQLIVSAGERGIYSINPKTLEAKLQIDYPSYTTHLFSFQGKEYLLSGGRNGIALAERKGDSFNLLWSNTASLNSIITGIEQDITPKQDSLILWFTFEEDKGIKSINTSYDSFIKNNFTFNQPENMATFPKGFVYATKIENQIYFLSQQGIYKPSKSKDKPSIEEAAIFNASFLHKKYPLNKIYKDYTGELWIAGADKVIFRCTPNSYGKYECDSITFKSLDIGNIHSFLLEKEGVWISGSDGLGYFNKSEEGIKNVKQEYNAKIRLVTTENDSILFFGNTPKSFEFKEPVLEFDNNALTFHYASLFFEDAEDILYSYRISGNNKGWSKWKKEPKTAYTNLWEGNYTFEVKARNVYGTESNTAQFNFTILPPIYRTYQAYALYLFLFLSGIWSIIRLNTSRLNAEKQRLERLVKARTKEIEEQNEEIKAKNTELELQKEEITSQAENLKIANNDIVKANKALEGSKKAIEEKSLKITSSINYAKRIQDAMLPSKDSIKQHLPDSFIVYKPRDIVSGDFYWSTQLTDENGHKITIIAAVDCTGHGVPGAFMSMLGDAYLNQIVLFQKTINPANILYKLNESVKTALHQESNQNRDGMDMVVCTINHSENKLYFSGARNPLIYIKDKQLFRVNGDNFSVAGRIKKYESKYTTHEVPIESELAVYLFTDGFQDQFGGEKGKKFMTHRFRDLLLQVHDRPMEMQEALIEETFDKWTNPNEEVQHEQVDDILIVGFRLKPA